MSATLSASTQRPYGVARVCAAWKVSRSRVYRHRGTTAEARARRRPGPQPELSDEALAGRIRARQDELEREYGIRGEGTGRPGRACGTPACGAARSGCGG